MYDPQIARFHSIDRLTEKFYYMTPYQYCSNSPIAKVEIDGLEGIWFHKDLMNSSAWGKIHEVVGSTTSHKRFEKTVKKQKKYNIYYFSYGGEAIADGYTNVIKDAKHYYAAKYENDFGIIKLNRSGTGFLFKNFNDKEIEKLFENGKSVIFIGINENHLSYKNNTELANSAATELHEENAHALSTLEGKDTSMAEEHNEYYNNNEGNWSPSENEVRTNPIYNGSQAKQDLNEVDYYIQKQQQWVDQINKEKKNSQ